MTSSKLSLVSLFMILPEWPQVVDLDGNQLNQFMTKQFHIFPWFYAQDAEIFVTALLKAHEEEMDFESKQALGETESVKYKGMVKTPWWFIRGKLISKWRRHISCYLLSLHNMQLLS